MKENKLNSSNALLNWVDYRLPIISMLKHSAVDYPTPKNLNYWWNFGSLAGFFLTSSNYYRYNTFDALYCSCGSCFFFY